MLKQDIHFTYELHESLVSTQDRAKELLRVGSTKPVAVQALTQISGRGRLGRVWLDSPGAILCSVGIQSSQLFQAHANKLPLFSFFVAKALADLINSKNPKELVRLKWPNDLVVTRSLALLKLGGILLEGFQGSALIAGFGINGQSASDDLPPDAISLEDLGIATEAKSFGMEAIACVTNAMMSLQEQILCSKNLDLQDLWNEHMLWMKNRHVEVRSLLSGLPQQGSICGLQDDGKLLLKKDNGEVVALHSGEVKILFSI